MGTKLISILIPHNAELCNFQIIDIEEYGY